MLTACYHARCYVRYGMCGRVDQALLDLDRGGELHDSGALTTEWQNHLADWTLLIKMAQSEMGSIVIVTVNLNERWVPTRGWSSGHLLSAERAMFTHAWGNPCAGYRGERHGTPAGDAVVLPHGWEWSSEWVTSMGDPGFDESGFSMRRVSVITRRPSSPRISRLLVCGSNAR